MKSIKYFAAAIVMMFALAACTETNAPQNPVTPSGNSETADGNSETDDPGTDKTIYKVIFSNQSEDPYAVLVQNDDRVDQFDLEGNSNVTKKYPEGIYKVKLTQKSGYTFYATVHEFRVNVNGDGTIYWDNDDYSVNDNN